MRETVTDSGKAPMLEDEGYRKSPRMKLGKHPQIWPVRKYR